MLPCSVDTWKDILLAIINTQKFYLSVEKQSKFWFLGKVVLGNCQLYCSMDASWTHWNPLLRFSTMANIDRVTEMHSRHVHGQDLLGPCTCTL